MKKVLNGEATGEDFMLKPFDMVYVPKTELAQADEFMSHIYNLIPRNVYFSFNYDLKRQSITTIFPAEQGNTFKIGQ